MELLPLIIPLVLDYLGELCQNAALARCVSPGFVGPQYVTADGCPSPPANRLKENDHGGCRYGARTQCARRDLYFPSRPIRAPRCHHRGERWARAHRFCDYFLFFEGREGLVVSRQVFMAEAPPFPGVSVAQDGNVPTLAGPALLRALFCAMVAILQCVLLDVPAGPLALMVPRALSVESGFFAR